MLYFLLVENMDQKQRDETDETLAGPARNRRDTVLLAQLGGEVKRA